MIRKSLALALITCAAPQVWAATTQADADKIKVALKPYLSVLVDKLKITPSGDGFKLAFDLAPLLAKAKEAGTEVKFPSIEMMAKPLGGNKWQLLQQGDFEFAAQMPNGHVSEKLTGMSASMTIDLDQGMITDGEGKVDAMTVDEEIAPITGPKMSIQMTNEGATYKLHATPAANGGVDATVTYKVGALSYVVKVDDKDMPMNFNLTAAGGVVDSTITGLKGKPFLDIWKIAVANLDKKKLEAKDQAAVKSALAEALPWFNNLNYNGRVDKLRLMTPIGEFAANQLGGTMEFTGLSKDAKFGESFSLEGLTIPAGLAPAWSSSLIPQNASGKFNLSGFDLATWSKGIVEAVDFNNPDIVPKVALDTLAATVMPTGVMNIAFGPSAVSNAEYGLSYEGSLAAGPSAKPTGKAKIALKGFDAILKAVTAAPPEAKLKDAGAAMIVAKGLSKTEADGSMSWDIEASPDGKVLVNGTDVKSLK